MRTFTRLLSLLAAFLLPFAVWSNVIIKGTVKNSNGVYLPNYTVQIASDSTTTNCITYHSRLTNPNGFYVDTIFCTGTIAHVTVKVPNCNGTSIIHYLPVGSNGIVESNFEVCVLPPSCFAGFVWSRSTATALRILFTDSSHTGLASDSIIKRYWSFGDSTYDSTHVNPEHTYPHAGIYNVCLKIVTRTGCSIQTCHIVQVGATECRAAFTFSPITAVPNKIKFNSDSSAAGPQDSIISRTWNFGDGSSLTGNVIAPEHQYPGPGNYNVCLVTKTAQGCEKTICKLVVIQGPRHCEAVFYWDSIPAANSTGPFNIKFYSAASHGVAPDSVIISRKWKFGDGTGISTGNEISPLHAYAQAGQYNVCLFIVTAGGCSDSICHTIVVRSTPARCEPRFTQVATGLNVLFNSAPTGIAPGDSIIHRTWTFGDGTSNNGNQAIVDHHYQVAGEYNVCLRIETRGGCVQTWCKKFAVVTVAGNCVPYFTFETTAARTIRVNSSAAYSQLAGDSIISRLWDFGDGQTLGGNNVNPLHVYAQPGAYTVCLKLQTRLGCDTRWCREIRVQADSNLTGDAVKIINLYPVPVTVQLTAIVWSRYNNVSADVAVYDVYGVRKWGQTRILPAGNSTQLIPTAQLANGPYILRITTVYGIVSKNFYKVQ